MKVMIPENTEEPNQAELPVVQTVCTHSEHAADNLNCLRSITEFMNDSVIAMGNFNGDFHQDTADGMSYILSIISHDLKVIAQNLPIGGKA